MQMASGPRRERFLGRERIMAENAQWLLEQEGPSAKMVLWGHNAHVSLANALPNTPLGRRLRAELGDSLYVFGFAFNQGSFQAMHSPQPGQQSQGLIVHTVPPARQGTLDAALASVGLPLFALDLRGVSRDTPLGAFLHDCSSWRARLPPRRLLPAAGASSARRLSPVPGRALRAGRGPGMQAGPRETGSPGDTPILFVPRRRPHLSRMKRVTQQGPRVVIVGAGFGGLQAARALKRAPVQVTVVDRYNHHLFQPLLYQVATSVLSPGDITAPIRRVLRSPNTSVLLAEARSIDTARKVVVCDAGELPYDVLVLATGATHSYFGHPEWEAHAPGLKTIDDALEIRRRVLLAFEAAERESDPVRQQEWLTFVIIGGGATGVELAGALGDLTHITLRKEFRRIDPTRARILLLEGLPRVLTAYPESLSERARRDLQERGVEVWTGAMVTGVDATGVQVGDKRIQARTVLWGAGVAASPLMRSLGVPLDRAGRVKVSPTLTVPGHEDIFVIGDVASLQQEGRPVPGVAPAAMQMGEHVARNIRRRLKAESLLPFRYRDRGSFAVIGRGAAVGVTFHQRLKLKGWLAYLGWAGIHVFFLIGFRNRVSVMLEWTYYFLTRRREVRLITGSLGRQLPSFGPSPTAERRPLESGGQEAPVH
ncbi:FAD-dependent oxidoreductase [Hyalangium gracile]|uniref:FAD-dependent oxidoreductase n=1 Tax=Hyalangium gracile TaxID=394092 RepID=UPI00295ED3D4|nr:FAD-dependent oxidoreductase [Hyalangium gracile]